MWPGLPSWPFSPILPWRGLTAGPSLRTTQPAGTDYERSRTSLRFSRVGKEYGSHIVLESISTQVQEGEFVSLVGTSGCGKSTF